MFWWTFYVNYIPLKWLLFLRRNASSPLLLLAEHAPLNSLTMGSSRSACWSNKESNSARNNVTGLVWLGFSKKTSLTCNCQPMTNLIMKGLVGSYSFIVVWTITKLPSNLLWSQCGLVMCKQPVLAFYCSRPLIYEGHIGFQFHEGNSEFKSEERNSDSNSNSNDGNSNSIPPGLGKANSIPIPELDLELARKSNSGAQLTPTLQQAWSL